MNENFNIRVIRCALSIIKIIYFSSTIKISLRKNYNTNINNKYNYTEP